MSGDFVRGFCPGGFCPGGFCPDTKRYITINLLKVIEPVDFHYFGKANKSHFDHRVWIKMFSLQFDSYYLVKSQNGSTVRPHYQTLKGNRNWFCIVRSEFI